jgi:uncharacterized membrane protein
MTNASWGVLLCASMFGLVSSLACGPAGDAGAPRPKTDDTSVTLSGVDDSTTIPCAPRHVLQTVCQHCHLRPPANGAPFPLERRSDLDVVYGGVAIRELALEEVSARRMPLEPITIGEEDRAVLLDWLRAGAPPVPAQTCSSSLDAGVSDTSDAGLLGDVDVDAGDVDAAPGDLFDGGDPRDADTGGD